MNEDIKKAKATLIAGGIICYPTDTIWGLGCDATNPEAVEKLFKIKKRDTSKSMLILLNDIGRVPSYIEEMPDVAYDLFETATSPLTLILPNAKNLAPNLIADDGSIAVRIIDHPWCNKLLQQFKKPIVSTSANFSGDSTAKIYDDISEQILSHCDYVAEYDRDNIISGKSSSIIKLGTGGEVEIIRE
ncbi:L-threonylcarbamoyladenylate synthase [Salinivirga cyanobacteriivorans]|uniref:L-threonylcarbamoyladenylate synthase n=1 Tax=Salinivirga cyanobacteriivorans TaxID=1307839 RepID=A0A0S2I214_9BACT|nr:L-threonylcarbamoyladenylate synthase [Salinivirga cyanobacteriivorans]ALO16288.1 t(6)A37 threonylcarbamoyladenosine biosynthesis protein RimN [Salinivirga cyanobacteriivorans]